MGQRIKELLLQLDLKLTLIYRRLVKGNERISFYKSTREIITYFSLNFRRLLRVDYSSHYKATNLVPRVLSYPPHKGFAPQK